MSTASWVFGSILLLFLMWMVISRMSAKQLDPPDDTINNVVGILCGVMAALFGYFFTGDVVIHAVPDAGPVAGTGVEAAGGAALFVIVLWWWRSGKRSNQPQKDSPNKRHE